jgi:ribosomal protein S18 acetylase RimI-like enzyme
LTSKTETTEARYNVEPVQGDDLRAVMRLAWKHRSPPLPGIFFEEAARNEGDYFRVVRDASTNAVVGFILTARLPLQERNMLLLVVQPELVGIGLRRALLRTVQAALKRDGEQRMVVEVPITETDSIQFYQREGFQVIGIEPTAASGDQLLLAAALPT